MLGFFSSTKTLTQSYVEKQAIEDRTTSVRDAASACARLVVNSKSVPVIIYKVHRIIPVEMSYVHDYGILAQSEFMIDKRYLLSRSLLLLLAHQPRSS